MYGIENWLKFEFFGSHVSPVTLQHRKKKYISRDNYLNLLYTTLFTILILNATEVSVILLCGSFLVHGATRFR